MTTVVTLVALAILFAIGFVAGMISAAGAYAHLERRLTGTLKALETIATTTTGDGSQIAWDALEAEHALRKERLPRALD